MKTKISMISILSLTLILFSCKVYELGDAPDEVNNPALHYCTHLRHAQANCTLIPFSDRNSPPPWTNYDAASHRNWKHEWLGDIRGNCASPCSGVSANEECNGKTINMDTQDDGVNFDLFHYPFSVCDIQAVDVMINTDDPTAYSQSKNLHLYAWFDWNQDGDWDDVGKCNYEGTSLATGDNIYWLTAQPLCPSPGTVYTINSYDFSVNPTTLLHWPIPGSKCQIFRLKFLSGKPATATAATDTLWCRFRLSYSPKDARHDIASLYYGEVSRGEVEDYPITQRCGPFTDIRDGRLYDAVQIGTQCWMAENLDYSDNPTFLLSSSSQENNIGTNIVEKYCYDDSQINCDDYGGLYQWAEAMAYVNGVTNSGSYVPTPPGFIQGICPPGWHLPSDAEWCIMENFLEPTIDPNCNIESWYRGNYIGDALKEPGIQHWSSTTGTINNSSGFTARGGGLIDGIGVSSELKEHGHWWTTDQKVSYVNPTNPESDAAFFRHLFQSNSKIGRGGSGNAKTNAHSIRCIRN